MKPRVWFGILLAFTFAVYAPSLGNDFALDDVFMAKAQITHNDNKPNPIITKLRPVSHYFLTNYWFGAGRNGVLYRPLAIWSYALTHAAFGDGSGEALPHHIINVLLHLLAVWLAYLMLRRARVTRGIAVLATAAFALNAIHSEVVAAIVGRAELFAFCFGAAALLLCESARRHVHASRWIRLAAAALAFFLSFSSKENGLAWLPFTPIYLAVIEKRIAWTKLAGPLGVAAVAAVVWFGCRQAMIAEVNAEPPPPDYLANPIQGAFTSTRVLSGITFWAYGIYKTLCPVNLIAIYGTGTFRIVESATDPRFLVAVAVLLAIAALTWWTRKRKPLVLLATLTFFGFSAITANIIVPVGVLFAERLYFASSLALAFVVAAIAPMLTSVNGRRIGLGLLGAWVLLCCLVIVRANGAWKNTKTVYERDLEANPTCAVVNLVVSELRRAEGEEDACIALLHKAIDLLPEYVEAHYNLGLLHLKKNEPEKAIARFEQALASKYEPKISPETRIWIRTRLAPPLIDQGNTARACSILDEAQQINAELTREHFDPLVEVLGKSAADWLERFLLEGHRREPQHPQWEMWYAIATFRNEKWNAAEQSFGQLLERLRGNAAEPDIRVYLAKLAQRSGRSAEARQHLDAALSIDPSHQKATQLRARWR